MTMTPNELPQMYVLSENGKPLAAGNSIHCPKGRGKDKRNKLFTYD